MSIPLSGYDTLSFTNTTGEIITGLVLAVDLQFQSADFKTNFNSDDGGRIRATKSGGLTELACDCVDPDSTAKTGQVYINWGTLAVGATAGIRLFPPNTDNSIYLPSDAFGSDNAYPSTIKAFYSDGGQLDRTVNSNNMTLSGGVVSGGISGLFGKATEFNGVDQWGTADNSILVNRPMSILTMHRPLTVGATQIIAGIFNNLDDFIWFTVAQKSTDENILYDRVTTLTTTTGGLTNTTGWNTIAASSIATNSRKVSSNGESFVSDAAALGAYTGMNTFSIGRLDRLSPTWYFNGYVQQVEFYEGEISSGYADIWRSQRIDNDLFWGSKVWNSGAVSASPSNLTLSALILEQTKKTLIPINTPDNTVYLLAMGQSNMLGRDTVATKSTNVDVEIANTTSGVYEVWDLTSNPPQNTIPDPLIGSDGPIVNGDSPAYYFANKIADDYGVKVKVLCVAWGGVAIAPFKSGGVLLDEVISQFTTFAPPRIDCVLWLQGESDSGSATYVADLEEVIVDYRSNALIPADVPWINSQIFDKTAFDTINSNLNTVAASDPEVWTTSSVGLADIGDTLHFDSASILTIAEDLWPVPFEEAVPTINANSQVIASPNNITLSSIIIEQTKAFEIAKPLDLTLSAIILEQALIVVHALPNGLLLSSLILGQTRETSDIVGLLKVTFTASAPNITMEGDL